MFPHPLVEGETHVYAKTTLILEEVFHLTPHKLPSVSYWSKESPELVAALGDDCVHDADLGHVDGDFLSRHDTGYQVHQSAEGDVHHEELRHEGVDGEGVEVRDLVHSHLDEGDDVDAQYPRVVGRYSHDHSSERAQKDDENAG